MQRESRESMLFLELALSFIKEHTLLCMTPRKEMSVSCRVDLDAVVKGMQELRKSGVLKANPALPQTSRNLPLIELFAEEAKFLRHAGVKTSDIVPSLMANLGLPKEGPFGVAAEKISRKVDEPTQSPSYHNEQHVVEVVLASQILGRREKLPIYRLAELLLAAAAHDLGHTGVGNQFHYERESVSVQIAQPILIESGLPAENCQRIEQMILATDFKVGVPWARQKYADSISLPPNNPDRLLASQCLLLTEADVLFSCFDLSYNEFLSKLLSAEWKRHAPNLSLQERIQFLSFVRFLSEAATQLGLEERRLKLLEELKRLQQSNSEPL